MYLYDGPSQCACTPGQVGKPLGTEVNPAGQDWEAGYETKLVSCATCEVNRHVEARERWGRGWAWGDMGPPGPSQGHVSVQALVVGFVGRTPVPMACEPGWSRSHTGTRRAKEEAWVFPKEDGDLSVGGWASWGDWSPGASWRIYPPLLPALIPPLPVPPWLETGGEGKLGWWGTPGEEKVLGQVSVVGN